MLYAWAVLITAACTLIAALMFPYFELANLVMIYLLGVTVAGLRLGRGPSVLTALLNVAAFDVFFVPPRFNFAVSDVQYLLTFAVMLIVALVIATLVANVRQQTQLAAEREQRTALLYALSRELAAARDVPAIAELASRRVTEVFERRAVVVLPDAAGDPVELRVEPDDLTAEQGQLLATFAGLIALALERVRLADQAEAARVAGARESLRNTLLASISHDLRTPLAVMAGAGSTLADHGDGLDETTRKSLARTIETRAREMSRLISNVLDLMRFESGATVLHRKWESLDDLVGAALHRLGERLAPYAVDLRFPQNLPGVHVDAGLIVQVFANLLENVAKYTPAGTHVWIEAIPDGASLRVTVEDDGPGLPAGDPARLFDKFQRGGEEGTIVGAGLGLAICRAIVQAHGGTINASNRAGGGARFELTLPTTGPRS